MADDSERNTAHQEIGYLSPDEAEQYHVDRLAQQSLTLNVRPMPRRRSGNVRGFNDGEPTELTGLVHLDEEQHATNRRGMAAIRAVFAEIDDKRIADIAGDDEVLGAALRRARDARRKRDQTA